MPQTFHDLYQSDAGNLDMLAIFIRVLTIFSAVLANSTGATLFRAILAISKLVISFSAILAISTWVTLFSAVLATPTSLTTFRAALAISNTRAWGQRAEV